jgi:hypothetical protein
VRHNRRFRWVAIPIAATLAIVLAGCTQAQLHGFLPGFVEGQQPVTNHTDRISGLWVTSWIVLLIVGIIVWGLILWAVVVYRRRKGQTGSRSVALQHADRDLLHDRAAHPGPRLLRLHGA